MKVTDRRVEAFMGDLDDFGGEKGPQVATKSWVRLVEPHQLELVFGRDKQKIHLLVLVHHVDAVLVVANLELFRLELVQNVRLGEEMLQKDDEVNVAVNLLLGHGGVGLNALAEGLERRGELVGDLEVL